MSSAPTQASLNLTSEEKRAFGQLFQQADTDKLGVVTGDEAVNFFKRTRLESNVLAEIWQIADIENRGLLTPAGFSVALRLIGHCQAGREPSAELSTQPGPLPKFDALGQSAQTQPQPQPQPTPDSPQPLSAQTSGPIRVPPLTPDKANEYSGLFDQAGARNGYLAGDNAKQMFEKARLPNEALGRIWNLADTEQRGALNLTEFIIAMHLIASMKTGNLRALPQSLPAGLYEAASRRGSVAQVPAQAVPRQYTGPQRTQSPLSRSQFGPQTLSPQQTGDSWVITPQDKARFDQIFATVDKSRTGYINGEQAVQFFSTSGLSEDILASIWDLADINSEGQLNRDEFAVAMYLIRQQKGKRDDRGNLPTALPANLVPPSMRQQTMPPSQPTAPAFDNAAFAPQQPKSAADDLFGLDAMAASDQASRQATSPPTSPVRAQTAQSPPAVQNTAFKPFVPTSSFGQGLTTQSTGGSIQQSQTQSRGFSQSQTSTGGDDLLGDNDAAASSKISDETMELGNMSNQIGQLRSSMQEVQTKKGATEREVNAASEQRRELETRLSQFRSQYEQEVKEVKVLEERLNTSRAETRKMQQEMAMVEGALQDLQTQHQQVGTALEADQRENASLKERIQQMNAEVGRLRPELDKMRSDARQQKGMVAINKKQLATSENERDKIQGEMTDLEKESAERSIAAQAEQQQTSSSVTSPSLSSAGQSTNPFFRRSPEASAERSMSPAAFDQPYGTSSGQSAFDSFFGPSDSATQPAAPPPATTFRSATPEVKPSTPPIASPSASNLGSPQVSEPPAPPESRQITSSALPLRGLSNLRSESFSSSVKANPPGSRAGESASATPTRFTSTPAESLDGDGGSFREQMTQPEAQDQSIPIEQPASSELQSREVSEPVVDTIKPEIPESTIPGAFPADTPGIQTPSTTGSDQVLSRSVDADTEPTPTLGAADTATTDYGERSLPAASPLGNTEPSRPTTEFPPIQELQPDDDSSSDGESGFGDDFASAAPPAVAGSTTETSAAQTSTEEAASSSRSIPIPQSAVEEVEPTGSGLPTPTAQNSPPSYIQSVPPESAHRESNQFPPEFGGLLPSREITTSPPAEVPQSPPAGLVASGIEDAPAVNGTSAPTVSASKAPAADDEFDSAFDDLTEAQEADDAGDKNPFTFENNDRDQYEFNPMFDSPAPSREPTTTSFADRVQSPTAATPTVAEPSLTRAGDGFSDFAASSAPTFTNATSKAPEGQSADSSSHDWDEIFSGLDNSSAPQAQDSDPFSLSSPSAATAQKPPLTRGLSTGTEHDDPILKTLTSMGYARDDAVKALEKYDYNLDMAADYLTSKT